MNRWQVSDAHQDHVSRAAVWTEAASPSPNVTACLPRSTCQRAESLTRRLHSVQPSLLFAFALMSPEFQINRDWPRRCARWCAFAAIQTSSGCVLAFIEAIGAWIPSQMRRHLSHYSVGNSSPCRAVLSRARYKSHGRFHQRNFCAIRANELFASGYHMASADAATDSIRLMPPLARARFFVVAHVGSIA